MFFRQYFKRHAQGVRAFQKAPPVGSFAHRARADGANRFGAIAIGDGLKFAQNFEPRFGRFWTQLAGLKNFPAQTNRVALLRENSVVFRMIDCGDLPSYSIAADVDYRKMISHYSTLSYHRTSAGELELRYKIIKS